MAPTCIAAVSTKWNSGRLFRRIPIVWPRSRPSDASPAASRFTFSAYSPQVIENSSPFVRIATASARSAAVTWKAAHIVGSSRAA